MLLQALLKINVNFLLVCTLPRLYSVCTYYFEGGFTSPNTTIDCIIIYVYNYAQSQL